MSIYVIIIMILLGYLAFKGIRLVKKVSRGEFVRTPDGTKFLFESRHFELIGHFECLALAKTVESELRHFGKEIIIHQQFSTHVEPIEDGKIHLFLYATPRPTTPMLSPEYLTRELVRPYILPPSGAGRVVRDEQGTAVLEVLGDSIYLLINPFREDLPVSYSDEFPPYLVSFHLPSRLRNHLLELVNLRAQSAEFWSAHENYVVRTEKNTVLLTPTPRRGRLETDQYLAILNLIEEKLLEVISFPRITVHDVRGERVELATSSESFHVWLNGFPAGSRQVILPRSYRTIGVERSFSTSGQGQSLMDSNGTAFAEVFGGNLLVLPDLFPERNGDAFANSLGILEQILGEFVSYQRSGSSAYAASVQERCELETQRNRSRFFPMLIPVARQQEVARRAGLMASNRVAFVSRQIQISTLEAENAVAEVLIPKLEAERAKLMEQVRSQRNKLLQIPNVTTLSCTAYSLELTTAPITVVHPNTKKKHRLGRYAVSLFPSGQKGGVVFRNLDFRIDAFERQMHGPMIGQSGTPLSGPLIEALPKLLGMNELHQAAMLAVRWLSVVNIQDPAGAFLERWPVAE